jgi:hypothetical protein
MRRLGVLAAASAAILALGACGSDGPSSSVTPSPASSPSPSPSASQVAGSVDACKLVTQNEASILAGNTTLAQAPATGGDQATIKCLYTDASLSTQVVVAGKLYGDSAAAKAGFEELAKGVVEGGLSGVQVTGIGDVAEIVHAGSVLDLIVFAKGKWAVMVAVRPPAADTALQSAGFTAASRLP